MTGGISLQIGPSTFEWGTQTYLMGIVNVTPDSFSGDGLLSTDNRWVERAVEQGIQQEKQGAHIIDVGGESTRPGSTPVSLEEELARVIPVIRALSVHVRIPISVDTYKSEVAKAALSAGASIINDVWGFHMDSGMADVARETGATVILMHNRSKPKDSSQETRLGGRYVGVVYENLIEDIKRELLESIAIAHAVGVARDKIIVEPGIGFGKTVEQNIELVNRFRELKDLGYPILAGPSRKSFVGYTLDLPPADRLEGTAAAVTLLTERGADIIRVHDVQAMSRVVSLTKAIVRS